VLAGNGGATVSLLRNLWNARLAGRATPLLVVVLSGERAAICWPGGDSPPAFLDLDVGRVERICRAALAEPNRNAALRFLATVIPEADGPFQDFATRAYLRPMSYRKGCRVPFIGPAGLRKGRRSLGLRGDMLLEGMGYTIEAAPGPVSVLRAGAEIEEARKKLHAAQKAAVPIAALFDILAAARLDDQCRQALWQDGPRWLKNLRSLPGSETHERARKVLAAIPPFHFPVVLPEAFLRERPGFDVMLGNPPWEEATVEEDRFWASHLPLLHSKSQKVQEDERKRMRRERPDLWKAYEQEKSEAELMRSVLTSGQYPGMGTGDPDVYKAFYWRFWELLSDNTGWAGVVLPRSAMSAKGSAQFRERAFTEGRVHDLIMILHGS
jgi:hypothetical protein